MPCCSCQRLRIEVEFAEASVAMSACGYYNIDDNLLYLDLAGCPSAEGFVETGGTCSADSSGETSPPTFTNLFTVGDAAGVLSGYSLDFSEVISSVFIDRLRGDGWSDYVPTAFWANDPRLDVTEDIFGNPYTGLRRELKFRFRLLAYPLDVIVMWKMPTYDSNDNTLLSTPEDQVNVPAIGWSDWKTIACSSVNTYMLPEFRLIAPALES